jgi:hypothetical protein
LFSDVASRIFFIYQKRITDPSISTGITNAVMTYSQTGSWTQTASAFTSGFMSGGASATVAIATALSGGSTLLSTAAAAAVDVGFSFLMAPMSLRDGAVQTIPAGLNAATGIPSRSCLIGINEKIEKSIRYA